MKLIPIIILIIFFSGCNGELEHPVQKVINIQAAQIKEVKQIPKEKFKPIFHTKKQIIEEEYIPAEKEQGLTEDIIKRSEKYNELMMPVKEIDLDIGFRYVGPYVEDGCKWKMYKKEYKVTWLYIHVDCEGNRIKIHKDK